MDPQALRRAHRHYIESRIRAAHPVEIVSMLFETALESLQSAIEHLKTRDHFARSGAVTRAEQAVHELLIALDHSVDPAFTRRLAGVYGFALQRIVAGHAQKSAAAFREAIAVLTPLASAWATVKRQISGGAPASSFASEDATPEDPRILIPDPYAAYRSSPGVVASRDWSC